MVRMKEKEARLLGLLQYAYKNVAVLTPAKMYAEAKKYKISEDMVDFILNDTDALKHNMIGDMHVYVWALKLKQNGGDLLPNIYMVQKMLECYDAIKTKIKEQRDAIKSNISKMDHPVFDKLTDFKIKKLITHMYVNTQEWTNVKIVKPSDVMNEIELGADCLTVMIYMNVLLVKGTIINRDYKWNKNALCDDNLVLEILENRKKYKHDRASIKRYADLLDPVVIDEPVIETAPEKTEDVKKRASVKYFSWTEEEEWAVIQGVREGMNYVELARLLGRSNGAVSGKIHFLQKAGKIPGKIPASQGDTKQVENIEPKTYDKFGKENTPRPNIFKRLYTRLMTKLV